MSRYATRHHPSVIARQLASGIPPLNAYRAADWRERLVAMGENPARSATKRDLYRMWLEARARAEGRS